MLLLHAPDEYLVVPGHGVPRRGRGNAAIGAALKALQGQPFALVQAVNVGRSALGARAEMAEGLRGAAWMASGLQSRHSYAHVPLLDPRFCLCSGPHSCAAAHVPALRTAAPAALSAAPVKEWVVDVEDMAVYHYVELLARDAGRCRGLGDSCTEPGGLNSVMAGAARRLQALLGTT